MMPMILLVLTYCRTDKIQDKSLTLSEYRELGVPDFQKEWSAENYSDAFYVLSRIKWDKFYGLPMKGSEKSGPLYSRLTNLNNLTFLKSESISIHDKAKLMLDYIQVGEDLIDLYRNPLSEQQYYQVELIGVYLFRLGIHEKMLDLAEVIKNTEDDRLKAALPSVQMVYFSGLKNILDIHSKSSQFQQEDIEVMADSISASILRYAEILDKSIISDIIQALKMTESYSSSATIKNKYKTCIQRIE